jgi:hypothetical protein
MRLNVIAVFVLATLALLVSSSALVKAYAQSDPMKCQTNALIGYGGSGSVETTFCLPIHQSFVRA